MSGVVTYGNAARWTVYTGVWTNWESGRYYGSTLTTTGTNGLLIVSFLAIFVGLLGGQTWGMICYITHQIRTTRKGKDGLHHQSQVVLRNSSSASATMWLLVKMAWAWRGRAPYSGWRVIPLILTALFQLVFFALAGTFSSYIFTNDNQALVRSDNCGFLPVPSMEDLGHFNSTELDMINAYFIEGRTVANWAWEYAMTCYGDNPAATCNSFSTPQLNITFQTVPCPFAEEMCLDPVNGTLQADTGYINTNTLGINSQYDISIDYRRVTTCAPIQTQGFWELSNYTGSNALVGEQRYTYQLGYDVNLGTVSNSSDLTWFSPQRLAYASAAYPLWTYTSYVGDLASSTFVPIEQLNRTDADVTLIFILNNAQYYSSSNDLLFNATTLTAGGSTILPEYYAASDPPAAVMGCIEQHQLCKPGLARSVGCTPLSGWDSFGTSTNFTGDTLAIGRVLWSTLGNSMLNDMFYDLGADALLASLSLNGGQSQTLLSSAMPAGHWQQEVKQWAVYALARIQKLIVNVAIGPSNPEYDRFIVSAAEYGIQVNATNFDFCANTKVRNAAYYSFSVFGLSLTVGIGTLIILLNTFLPTMVGAVQRATGRGLDRKEDWELDSILQVQRMTFEAAKLGNWTNMHGNIPITIKATEMRTFGKPGRGRGAYESVSARESLYSPGSEPAVTPDGVSAGVFGSVGHDPSPGYMSPESYEVPHGYEAYHGFVAYNTGMDGAYFGDHDARRTSARGFV